MTSVFTRPIKRAIMDIFFSLLYLSKLVFEIFIFPLRRFLSFSNIISLFVQFPLPFFTTVFILNSRKKSSEMHVPFKIIEQTWFSQSFRLIFSITLCISNETLGIYFFSKCLKCYVFFKDGLISHCLKRFSDKIDHLCD